MTETILLTNISGAQQTLLKLFAFPGADPQQIQLSATLNGVALDCRLITVPGQGPEGPVDQIMPVLVPPAPLAVAPEQTLTLTIDVLRGALALAPGGPGIAMTEAVMMGREGPSDTDSSAPLWAITSGGSPVAGLAVFSVSEGGDGSAPAPAPSGALELRPELLPGYLTAQPGTTPTRTPAGLEWRQASGGGGSSLVAVNSEAQVEEGSVALVWADGEVLPRFVARSFTGEVWSQPPMRLHRFGEPDLAVGANELDIRNSEIMAPGLLLGTSDEGLIWVDPANIQGAPGDKGDPGPAATVTVGTVTTLAPGAQATVTNRGTSSAAVFDFGIPKGADGAGGSGGTLDAEQVQDIVGAMVKAGTNTTITYDDAAGTLTINASATQSGGTPRLSTDAAAKELVLRSGNTTSLTGLQSRSLYWSFRPNADFDLWGAEDAQPTTLPLAFQVWTGSTRIASVSASREGGVHKANFGANPVRLLSGVEYRIGWFSTSESAEFQGASTAASYQGFTLGSPRSYYDSPPTDSADALGVYYPTMKLYRSLGVQQKSVTGPLDPVDFPISTAAAAPNSSGFMVVDDAAKTASLYWKFSDGTVKKIDLA